ncbi:hypothetical protein [Brevundimonas nasdae]|uniref:hypothetical protein n=1 Tax=Brevundimonas nasdae TaxID=172043 RepID=UPI003F68BF16
MAIRLFSVPGVPEIENRLILNDLTGTRIDHDLDRKIAKVIWESFGIEGTPEFHFEWAYDDEGENAQRITNIEHWRRAGWDITDNAGQELRCVSRFRAALICVAEGYAGKSMIDLEATIWRENKAKDEIVPPSLKAQNQNFLALGRPRRRPAA